MDWGDTRPSTADPAFIQYLSFPERRAAVNPWRIPPGPEASQGRRNKATPVNNMPRIIGSREDWDGLSAGAKFYLRHTRTHLQSISFVCCNRYAVDVFAQERRRMNSELAV
jgi:hypothetical protein